jgi:hypothetical protein
MSRLGSAKSKPMIVDGDDAGLSGPHHPNVATWSHTHFVQPHDEIRLSIHFDNRGRHAGREQSQGNHVPQRAIFWVTRHRAKSLLNRGDPVEIESQYR